MSLRCCAAVAFAMAITVSATAYARDFEMGADSDPYSIMAPEPGTTPHHRPKTQVHKRHATAPERQQPLASKASNTYPRRKFSVVRGSSGSVLPTPLPRTALIPPEGNARLTLPALPREQGPSIVPGIINPVPNLPHGAETFQDRASRCAFQSGLSNVPGNLRSQYIGGCVQ
ncbi:MAG: hypothetical protein WA652_09340 [Xanthobacteraceae bacterium]|jgi:hypothetical protein